MHSPWQPLVQLALDLFTGGDPEPPPASRRASAQPTPPASPAPPPPASPTTTPTATPGLPAPETPTATLGLTHPGANRHAVLQGLNVSYRFERSRRRSIGLSVGPEGLVVRAPGWVPLREIDAAVQEKAPWILAKLQQLRQRAQRPTAPAQAWVDGADLPYLGGHVRLCVLSPGQWPDLPEGVQALPLHLPAPATATQVRDAAEAWFKQQAQPLFAARLAHYAPQLGVQWQRLSLSSAQTRWGSARADGHIRLNWRLIHLPLTQIDYVVVHELAHLRVMNHSPQFWQTVGEVMPDWRERRRLLREHALAEPTR